MPYTIRKMPDQNCYRLAKPATKTTKRRVFAKCTTLANAKAQLRLLNALKYGKNFVPRGSQGGSRRTRKHRTSHMKK